MEGPGASYLSKSCDFKPSVSSSDKIPELRISPPWAFPSQGPCIEFPAHHLQRGRLPSKLPGSWLLAEHCNAVILCLLLKSAQKGLCPGAAQANHLVKLFLAGTAEPGKRTSLSSHPACTLSTGHKTLSRTITLLYHQGLKTTAKDFVKAYELFAD